jgi:hypothetical protein
MLNTTIGTIITLIVKFLSVRNIMGKLVVM